MKIDKIVLAAKGQFHRILIATCIVFQYPADSYSQEVFHTKMLGKYDLTKFCSSTKDLAL